MTARNAQRSDTKLKVVSTTSWHNLMSAGSAYVLGKTTVPIVYKAAAAPAQQMSVA